MRILLLYSSQPKLVEWARVLQGELENQNCRVELAVAGAQDGNPVSAGQYSLIVVLSPFRGWWRPIIPTEIDNLLKRCSRLDGKKGVALVPTRFGSGKALKFLMHLMEVQGVLVEDFATIRSQKDLSKIADRMLRLVKS